MESGFPLGKGGWQMKVDSDETYGIEGETLEQEGIESNMGSSKGKRKKKKRT